MGTGLRGTGAGVGFEAWERSGLVRFKNFLGRKFWRSRDPRLARQGCQRSKDEALTRASDRSHQEELRAGRLGPRRSPFAFPSLEPHTGAPTAAASPRLPVHVWQESRASTACQEAGPQDLAIRSTSGNGAVPIYWHMGTKLRVVVAGAGVSGFGSALALRAPEACNTRPRNRHLTGLSPFARNRGMSPFHPSQPPSKPARCKPARTY